MLRVLFFASARDTLGCDAIEMPYVSDINALLDALCARYGEQKTSCLRSKDMLIARNQEICRGDIHFNEGDEVAFLPPVSGG